jgi:hypothetical protein
VFGVDGRKAIIQSFDIASIESILDDAAKDRLVLLNGH